MIKTRQRRYVFDPTLASLASQLKLIHFDVDEDERADFFQRMIDGRARNVSCFMDGKTYRVRLYLGGKQRFIGATTNGPAAARFADMARLYFWTYRQRDCREPVLTDMNISVEQAQFDLNENQEAVKLLDSIKAHLFSIGALQDTALEEPKKPRAKVADFVATTLREQAAEVSLERAVLLKEAQEGRKDIQFYFGEIKTAFQHILERLDKLEGGPK